MTCISILEHTMNAENIFRCSIGCEIMLMIKARIRLIFSRNSTVYYDKLLVPIKTAAEDKLFENFFSFMWKIRLVNTYKPYASR